MNSEYGFEIGMSPPASTYSGQIDWLMGVLHVAMIGMFLIWGIYFVYCLIAYRARPGGQATYHQTGQTASFIPDGIVLAFELWLILGFGIPIWAELINGCFLIPVQSILSGLSCAGPSPDVLCLIPSGPVQDPNRP